MSFKIFTKYCILFFAFLLLSSCMSGDNPDNKNPFPKISGFEKSGEIVSYKPETLFEYINGAAELYLTYDFTELKVQVYDDKDGNTITAEIYDQVKVNNSFGIYSQERPYECEFLPIGIQANYMEGYLNFYQEKYYVKIVGYNLGGRDREYITSVATKISERLEKKSNPPKILKAFPKTNKIKNREEYISRDFLGYSFFEKAFVAEYEESGISYKLFIIEEPDRASLEKTIEEYKKSTGYSKDIIKGGIHEIDDPYQGKIVISISENYIIGILNPDNAKFDMNIMSKLTSKLN